MIKKKTKKTKNRAPFLKRTSSSRISKPTRCSRGASSSRFVFIGVVCVCVADVLKDESVTPSSPNFFFVRTWGDEKMRKR